MATRIRSWLPQFITLYNPAEARETNRITFATICMVCVLACASRPAILDATLCEAGMGRLRDWRLTTSRAMASISLHGRMRFSACATHNIRASGIDDYPLCALGGRSTSKAKPAM